MITKLTIVHKILPAILAGFLSTVTIADEAADWLMRINSASAEVSFSGVFIYTHDNKIEAMEVARRINKDGLMQERLYSLNGAPREVIRGMEKVWCYIPDQNVAVYDYRQITNSGFPKILPSDFEQIQRNYYFVEGIDERIADRNAHQIKVIPNDEYRYGFSLWADKETGLLLRSELVNNDDEIVEQYTFIKIQIGGVITDEQLAAKNNTQELQLYGADADISSVVHSSNWQVNNLPDGYLLSKHIKRMSPMNAGEIEHLVYTDGLSTVSIFIKEVKEGQSDMNGLSRMGSMHAFRKTIFNHRVTVMGEVPTITVEYVAMGIEHKI